MPRATRKKPVPIIAGSPALVCAMLSVRDDDIRPGINDGSIPVYMTGKRRRIFVEDAARYVRTFPQVHKCKGLDHAR
jgi:hypothetical protein